MKPLFYLSVFIILYTYLLYPFWLFIRARVRPRPVRFGAVCSKVSIVIAARNEEKYIEEKLDNLRHLDYPKELVEILIISDGSSDQTNQILNSCLDSRVRSVLLPVHVGKAAALNLGIAAVRGDIVVFMDARQRVAVDSVRILIESFADPSVGCVSGALTLGEPVVSSPRGVNSYWKMEKAIRYWESASGSAVGATGALYAVRRHLIPELPPGIILDDVFIPMEIARRGSRVVFEPRARAWDSLSSSPKHEFHRKVRTLFGNYQLLRVSPWLLTGRNPLRFEFISHKLCRLAVPFALLTMVSSSAFLSEFIYRLTLGTSMTLAVLGILAMVRIPLGIASRVADLALAFVLLNVAAVTAFIYFSLGKKPAWVN